MQRRGLRLKAAVVAALAIVTALYIPSATSHADAFSAKLTYSASFSSTLPGSTPTLTTTLAMDCPLGAAACPATSDTPLFDVSVLHYSANILSCGSSKPLPCNGNVPVDASVGTVQVHANTNLVTASLPDNVNAATGAPAACGAAGTTPLTTSSTLYNAPLPVNGTSAVFSRDGADVDSLPDTQADAIGPGTAGANGIPDGADGYPDYLRSYASMVIARAFGVIQIVPGTAQLDVNLLTIDLTSFGAGYSQLVLVDDPRSKHFVNPNAPEGAQLCTPFTMTLTQPGVSGDSFGSTWTANGITTTHTSHETPTPVRAIIGAAGDPIHYAIAVSGAEDADNDGVPPVADRCANAEVGGFPVANTLTAASGAQDADADGMGDSCDPDPNSSDNCPGTPFPGKSQQCNSAVIGGPNTGTTYPTHAPWDPDQDVDGDGFANWADNCPTAANPSQLDVNADGIGDACQHKSYLSINPLPPFALIAPVRCPPNCPPRPLHDHDDFCDALTSVGGAAPVVACYGRDAVAPTAGLIQDSDDDGFPDYLLVPGFNFTDKNADADWDGCSDYSELHNLDGTPCGGTDPRRPNTVPTTTCSALIFVFGLLGAGSSVSYTSTTLTDSNASWLPDALVGLQISAGTGSIGVVASNTSTDVTLTAAWSGGTPLATSAYTMGPCIEGNKDRDGNGVPDWKDAATDPSQQDNSRNLNGGSPDSDGDGCTNRREALPPSPIANGGGRDAMNTWDFYDVLTNNGGVLGLNNVISIADTIAVLAYVGTSVASPYTPNKNGLTYAGVSASGDPNFEIFDRSPRNPSSDKTGPPDGAITIGDAILNLNQIGANCTSP